MEYKIMSVKEAKELTKWEKDMDQEYLGVIPGFACGYNFEVVTREGKTDFFSCTFECLTPEEVMENTWYLYYIRDMECEPTGRVIFRGYFAEEYDPYEREYYYKSVGMNELSHYLTKE